MENTVDQLFNQLAEKLKDFAKTETIIGDEFQIGDFLCKPVIKIGMGFGGGSGTGDSPKGKGQGEGTGGAAGIGISPIGFLVTKGDEISFVSADRKKGLSSFFEKVPDLMEKMIQLKEKKENKEK
jgi:uncharacterized spore protein YtfJ